MNFNFFYCFHHKILGLLMFVFGGVVTHLPWIVGIKANGAYLGIGGRGPVWVVYLPPDGATVTVDDEARWVWSVLLIEVR